MIGLVVVLVIAFGSVVGSAAEATSGDRWALLPAEWIDLNRNGLAVAVEPVVLDGHPVEGFRRVTLHRTGSERQRWCRPSGWNGLLPPPPRSPRLWQHSEEALIAALADRADWRTSGFEVAPAGAPRYHVDERGALRLGVRYPVMVEATETTPYQEYGVVLDVETGAIVRIDPIGGHATITGVLRGRIPADGRPFSPSAVFVDVPLPLATVNAIGYPSAVSDSDGFFEFTVPATAAAVVSGTLTGPFFSIQNQAGPTASFLLFLMEGLGVTEVIFNEFPTETGTAEASAFAAVAKAHRFIERIAPGFGPAQVPVNLNVNVAGSCFAFYSPIFQSLNFSQAGGGCPNTAYGTIVAHEYYHHLQTGLPPASAAYKEAMADVFAAYTFESPVIGPDYLGPSVPLRTLDSGTLFPVLSADPAEEGQPLAEAFWDLRSALILTEGDDDGSALAGELWLAVQAIASGEVENGIVADLLWVDDDDSDLSNGTPHLGEIVGSFAAHGFAAPVPPIVDFICAPLETQVELTWTPPAGVVYQSFQIYRNGLLIGLAPGVSTSYVDLFPPAGDLDYELIPSFQTVTGDSAFCSTTLAPYAAFVRGDANGDGGLLVDDPIAILDYLFISATPPTACLDRLDADDNGAVQIGDAVVVLQFLFAGGPAPLPPFPLPGFDPTPDEMSCPAAP